MEEHLVAALLDLLAFLELSGDDVVHPDAAVAQMESTAHQLASLSLEDQVRLRKLVADLAATEVPPERAAFFSSLPEALGLQ